MKRTIILTAILCLMVSVASAEILWSGNVTPSDPSTWNSSTYGFVGNSSAGTMDITDGSNVINNYGYIGLASGSTGGVTLDGFGSTWTIDNALGVGHEGNGTLSINNGGEVSSATSSIGSWENAIGEVTVDGAGSLFSINDFLSVGHRANGTLNITGGGTVSCGRGHIGSQSGGTGAVTVDGAGSAWSIGSEFAVGSWGDGTLDITNGGLVITTSARLLIDSSGGGESFINMASGGMLAWLGGDVGESLVDFLGRIEGAGTIRYWDSSVAGWADIIGATNGLDYTLEYISDGDLAGYTMLTVPEPATMMLLGLGGVMLRKRRA